MAGVAASLGVLGWDRTKLASEHFTSHHPSLDGDEPNQPPDTSGDASDGRR